MNKYKKIYIKNFREIENVYNQLINSKLAFMIVDINGVLNVLTKEYGLFVIDSEEEFVEEYKNNKFYKTNVIYEDYDINLEDLNLFKYYINKYKDIFCKRYYGDYIFGCVAVKTDDGYITTIRGKKNLEDYTFIKAVHHDELIINVIGKKAALNAPLFDYLFCNKKVKVIVQFNQVFDYKLKFYNYAFPGTVKDSKRNNVKSFNINNHGVVYLIDSDGNFL